LLCFVSCFFLSSFFSFFIFILFFSLWRQVPSRPNPETSGGNQSHSRHGVVRSSLNSSASDYTIVRNQVSAAWKERKEGLGGGGGQGASEGGRTG